MLDIVNKFIIVLEKRQRERIKALRGNHEGGLILSFHE